MVRGWRGESKRHSLAARGVKTKNKIQHAKMSASVETFKPSAPGEPTCTQCGRRTQDRFIRGEWTSTWCPNCGIVLEGDVF